MVLVALLWARDIRRGPNPDRRNFRGPWTMGLIGVAVFVFYLWLVTHDAVYA